MLNLVWVVLVCSWFAVAFIVIVGFGCLVYEMSCFALMFGGSGVVGCGWVVVWSLLAVVCYVGLVRFGLVIVCVMDDCLCWLFVVLFVD